MRIFLLACVSIVLATACTQDLVTGQKSYNWFSLEEDVKLGSQVMQRQLAELKKEEKRIDKAVSAKRVRQIRGMVKELAQHSHYPDFPYEVHLADVPVVNAWCAPGGKMMVYTGLWDKEKGLVRPQSRDELAAVLGHELAHATARHVTESLSRNMTIFAASQTAVSVISASSPSGGNLFGEMLAHGVSVYLPSYSRKNELEADRLGLIYMAKAGYDPRAAVRLWKRAAKKRGDHTSIFASHPASGERAKQLEAYLPEAMQIYRKTRK